MKIKTLHKLQPTDAQADCVIVRDDFNNPIFAAVHVGETIVCASVGDNDFDAVLRMIGLTAPSVVELVAK
jgi:hypothetical protein